MPEVQTHVFEPFFTTKEPGKGTGLGLSTCYGIVKQHGGTIWLYSEPGKGTAVKVYLPEVADTAGTGQAEQPALQAKRGTETILVAEDEDAVRTLIARILRAQGYLVIEAVNGLEAVRVARAHAPAVIDLLLTDMVMPHLNGPDAALQIRAIYPDIKVLYLSGYTEHATLRHNRIALGSPFLQKPFTPSALIQVVRALLDRGGKG
jgi:two-component system cell cycle sensor histidine kinase/response regulator CckA